MKKYILSFTIVLAVFALPVQAQIACKNQSIEQLANDFAEAFESKTLAKIDANKPLVKQITIRIENSLMEDGAKGQYEYKKVKSYAMFEKWLKGMEVEELPNRSIQPLISCKNGICTYDLKGLLHNTLFLQKFSYGFKKDKCPFIKSVFIVDGN